ncbi:MAG: zf-HC2 protein [Bryobacterales bacterium]|nr:zf-HC2 protein [Bryobacterales bacterium]
MNHQEAIREMAVERYLLGELSDASLDNFEEHLFECSECAMDVKNGVAFIDAARSELSLPRKVASPHVESARRWTSWLISPWVLAPALAACLLILAFQTFVLQPRLKLEVARAQIPAVLNPLVLANAGARGDSVPEIVAPEHGSFVISLDVPTTGAFVSYRCSLHAPDGSLLWQTSLSPQQARDSLLIDVPTDGIKEGLSTFLIQGLPASGNSSGTLEDLARYRFRVKIQK